jgi:aminomuconate-semialdehyde/2-hydroxymuconate-6-semialdehyde dehydrogenase
MTAYLMAKLIRDSGIPKGVINIVFGEGRTCGQALTSHPFTPLISFTGGTVTAEKIIQASAVGKKKMSLELGGKNPVLIFEDANMDKCLETTVKSSFMNQGEICLCGARVYVHVSIYDEFISRFIPLVNQFKVGDPKEPGTNLGALISKEHREKVESYIGIAVKDGGKILCGGKRPALSGRCQDGYFLEPTVIVDLPHDSRAQQEEIFGPVITITKFGSEEEGIGLANKSVYGLSAVVWTENVGRANRVAQAVEAGTVWVNCWMARDLRMPFGGGKQSGVGREGQEDSMDFFCEKKVICLAIDA